MSDDLYTGASRERWSSLVRATVLTTNTRKFFGYIGLADQKAMGVIVLNSIIIPVVLAQISEDAHRLAATVSIISCIASLFAAIVCIFPKRGNVRETINPFHFSDVGRLTEEEYLDIMDPIYNTPSCMAEAVIKDLHDVSRHILRPKFFWLKTSYVIFFAGNLIAIVMELITHWSPL